LHSQVLTAAAALARVREAKSLEAKREATTAVAKKLAIDTWEDIDTASEHAKKAKRLARQAVSLAVDGKLKAAAEMTAAARAESGVVKSVATRATNAAHKMDELGLRVDDVDAAAEELCTSAKDALTSAEEALDGVERVMEDAEEAMDAALSLRAATQVAKRRLLDTLTAVKNKNTGVTPAVASDGANGLDLVTKKAPLVLSGGIGVSLDSRLGAAAVPSPVTAVTVEEDDGFGDTDEGEGGDDDGFGDTDADDDDDGFGDTDDEAAVLGPDGEALEEPPSAEQCDKGHDLEAAVGDGSQEACDGCMEEVVAGTGFRHCGVCAFVLCAGCCDDRTADAKAFAALKASQQAARAQRAAAVKAAKDAAKDAARAEAHAKKAAGKGKKQGAKKQGAKESPMRFKHDVQSALLSPRSAAIVAANQALKPGADAAKPRKEATCPKKHALERFVVAVNGKTVGGGDGAALALGAVTLGAVTLVLAAVASGALQEGEPFAGSCSSCSVPLAACGVPVFGCISCAYGLCSACFERDSRRANYRQGTLMDDDDDDEDVVRMVEGPGELLSL